MIQKHTIRSGEWAQLPGVADYRLATLSEIVVERLVWAQAEGPLGQKDDPGSRPGLGQQDLPGGPVGPGYIWFRFWLPRDDQVVEKYFDAQGNVLGTQVDVCAPLVIHEQGRECRTTDLLLDIWIGPEGRVIVRNEAAFEDAVSRGVLSAEEATWAESHVRDLTLGIANGRFPPPLVRNWQVDLNKLQESLGV